MTRVSPLTVRLDSDLDSKLNALVSKENEDMKKIAKQMGIIEPKKVSRSDVVRFLINNAYECFIGDDKKED